MNGKTTGGLKGIWGSRVSGHNEIERHVARRIQRTSHTTPHARAAYRAARGLWFFTPDFS
eukprot:CAMPEP_0118983110 /NCGR_PEP_ID=MMETSP1173-20130426/34555_1 /TAXON_ID=1034831 /ORGANISM="Rhizochromulina marina cf, Strain CCMP1243" /LENGTH=59 /DNA_ID=CAMNT_0006933655 /DNA_START=61 /DNA_END=237 /DNA_ORIENTATION=-